MRRREQVQEERLPAEAGGWSVASLGASANAVTVMRRSMWVMLVAGPVLGVWALLSAPEVVVPASQPVRQDRAGSQEGAGPGGFAELFLSAYLTAGEGTEASLAPFLPTARDVVLGADAGSQTVERIAAVKVRRAGGGVGYWSVTVAAVVMPASGKDPGGGRGAKSGSGGTEAGQEGSLRYFQVPVKAGKGGAWSAVALPAEVGAPVPSEAEALGYGPSAPANGSDAAVQTLAGFFSGFLAGAGDLDRYLSPGTSLGPVSLLPRTSGWRSSLWRRPVPRRVRLLTRGSRRGGSGSCSSMSPRRTCRGRSGRWRMRSRSWRVTGAGRSRPWKGRPFSGRPHRSRKDRNRTDLVALAGAIKDVDDLGKQLNTVMITTVMSLMLSASVIVTWRATKSVVAGAVAFVGGAALWFLVMNATVFRDSVGEDLKPSSASTSVVRAVDSAWDDGPVRFGGGR